MKNGLKICRKEIFNKKMNNYYSKIEETICNRKLRNLLFLCSFTACQHNKGCKEVYERIVNKGKSKKLALIAVSNKLIKQSFAIAKFGNPYDEKYVSVLPK